MGKIRVQDLARMMGIASQDLVFKLRSIGVRVEGDDAGIDTDVIQAIMQGKKLPSPREVFMDDASPADTAPAAAGARRAAAPTAAAPRRAPVNPLRPARPRTMIQKVEPRIKTLPDVERPPLPAATVGAAGAATAVEAPPATLADLVMAPPPETAAVRPAAEPAIAASSPAPTAPPAVRSPIRPPNVYRPVEGRPTGPARVGDARPGMARPSAAPRPPMGRPGEMRPGMGRPGDRPGPGRPGFGRPGDSRPGAPRPGAPGRPAPGRPAGPTTPPPSLGELRRVEATAEADKKKLKRGVKKPGGQAVSEEDLRALRGSLEEIEGIVDESVVPSGGGSARRRRRAESRSDASADRGLPVSTKTLGDENVVISEGMTVRDFADKLGVKAKDLIKLLFDRGIFANINHIVEPELGQKLAAELGISTQVMTFEEEVQQQQVAGRKGKSTGAASRPPVVTIMGHVDHGKTSLLDAIRSSKITEGEFGGITQHIGAYQVDVSGRRIVFLDTPGHEAFTMMRARGARATDIVVLVVAADDGVMPQTVEAIDHARAAGVPIVVAINKIDKPNANLEKVQKQLSNHDLMSEDWGGTTVTVPISAKQKQGIPALLEMILLTADLQELKADPELPAQGVVLEARKEPGRGIIATVLVQNGTLKVSDVFVSGNTWGRVRAMSNDVGERVAEAGPATPVEVTGFNEVPFAGDAFQVVEEEAKARAIVEFRQQEQRKRELAAAPGRVSLEQLFTQIQKGEVKELQVVIKADVQGSVEVLKDSLTKIASEKVKLKVLHSGVGAISTNDVLLASASKAIIVGFNVRPERSAIELAEKEQVDLRLHTVIYEVIEEMSKAMSGLLDPTFKEVQRGRAEVRETFKIPKVGTIAGCHVVEGVIPRSAGIRLLRDNRVVFEGKISSLKRFKDDASEVRSGFDCGIGIERFQDVKPGDVIEAFGREEVAPTL